jgi:hypothetical protein
MPSLSKSFKFEVPTGVGTTATSVALAYPMYPLEVTGTKAFTSGNETGAGYYGTTNGLHVVTITTTQTFVGTATIQATLATAPIESDWFDIDSAKFEYTTSHPEYIAPFNTGVNPLRGQHLRTDHASFTGQFTWLRTQVLISSGAITQLSYNY